MADRYTKQLLLKVLETDKFDRPRVVEILREGDVLRAGDRVIKVKAIPESLIGGS